MEFNTYTTPVAVASITANDTLCWTARPSLLIIKIRFEATGFRNMMIQDQLMEKRSEILRIAASHGARNIRVFGSVARGEARESSDIDFLVDLDPERNLLDLAAFLSDLRELLGREVDVVSEKGLYRLLRKRILKEARSL